MKENTNRGLLIAILVCLILLVMGAGQQDYYPEFPYQIDTYSKGDTILPLGDDKIIIHNEYGEVTVLQWDDENQTLELVETYEPNYDE